MPFNRNYEDEMENRDWLRSLSDRQLAEEIYYGQMLAAPGARHQEHSARELREAEEERSSRQRR